MKKLLAMALALCMILTLCAVASADDVKTYKVGVSIYQFTDNFMTLYRNEIENYFKSLETDSVKYEITMADGKNDMAEQTNQVQNFITQGMDVIILNLVQTSSADAVIDMVVDAGIPLVLINREPLAYDADGNTIDEAYEGILDNPTVCYVGADARQSGTFQGQMVLALDNKGDLNGDGKVSYIMIDLTDAGVEVEELFDQVGNWDQTKGQELCASALTQFGDKVEVVFCNNDAMALGAATAITAAGRTVGEDIYLYGVDALEEAVQLIKEGEMSGTVLNDAMGQSHAAVDVAIQLLNGEEIQNYYWVDYVMVDKAYAEANY